MKFYEMDTVFTFGKHKGLTAEEVFQNNPSYLEFCALNLDHFFLSEEVIEEIKSLKPDFSLSQKALDRLEEKYDEWLQKDEPDQAPDYNYQNNRDLDRDNFWALTDGMLGDYDDWTDAGLDIDDAMTYMRG